MIRISGGTLKGRSLKFDHSSGIRPTTDRVRQALFNILRHKGSDFSPAHKIFMDGFTGTGAVGFEAISHGAKHVLMVDQSREALMRIHQHAAHWKIEQHIQTICTDLLAPPCAPIQADLLFFDPPYRFTAWNNLVTIVQKTGWSHSKSLWIFETDSDHNLPTVCDSLLLIDTRDYGKSRISFWCQNE